VGRYYPYPGLRRGHTRPHKEKNMTNYEKYCKLMREIHFLDSSIANLQWDQEVIMPREASGFRSQQIAYLSKLSHQKFTAKSTEDLLLKLASEDLTDHQRVNVDKSLYDFQTASKLSTNFVEKRSELISASYSAWLKARQNEDTHIFLEALAPLLDLKKEEAELRAYEDHPYDALLNLYDKGLNVKTLNPLFLSLDKQLDTLIQEIKNIQEDHRHILEKRVPKHIQWSFNMDLLRKMQFDFNRGRQDISPHPFTISLSPHDIRLTTHSSDNHISPIIWGSIHEGGHALYEQHLPKSEYLGLPLGQAASLSIHESQARFWEIYIGKSIPFWTAFYPLLKKAYGNYAPTGNINDFLKAIHYITPNLIRTEADELHYHRHIIIRYDIEKKLMSNTLQINELEDYWNDQYKEKMSLHVTSPTHGLLQDVHWAHGGLGYFPTYTMGSIYAAELFDKMTEELPNVKEDIVSLDFSQVLNWLNKHIFSQGRKYESLELMGKILGHPPISSKLTDLYRKKIYAVYD
jgi:carboxypeptidase Taq